MDINNLIDRGGLLYAPNKEKPYTGLVFDLYRTTGNKSLEGRYKDGLKNGKWEWWSENGKMDSSVTYKNGSKNGKWTYWYENGQKQEEIIYKDGKLDGLMTDWYENGQKEYEGTFKDGEWISRECWDEDGNECECGYHGRCK